VICPYTLYLIRHGQTEDNLTERLTGQGDSPLTERGQEQARANGRLLRELIGDGIGFRFVASPLGRTMRTMRLAREAMELPLDDFESDPRLMEIHFGDWQGKPWVEAKEYSRKYLVKDKAAGDRWTVPWPNGESRVALRDRVHDFLTSVACNTVVVGHGGSVRMIRGILLKMDFEQILAFEAKNAGVIVIADGRETLHGY
jgi:broad specificity phosphatase PhoE